MGHSCDGWVIHPNWLQQYRPVSHQGQWVLVQQRHKVAKGIADIHCGTLKPGDEYSVDEVFLRRLDEFLYRWTIGCLGGVYRSCEEVN